MKVPVFRAMYEKVIVRELEDPRRTPGGILLPDQSRSDISRGVVVDIGDYIAGDINKGDVVAFRKALADFVTAGDETVAIIESNHVLCVIGEEDVQLNQNEEGGEADGTQRDEGEAGDSDA